MPPPFNINETSPAGSALISSFPADEQQSRATIEEWLAWISDPATGNIRSSVLPAAPSAEIPSGSKVIFVQTNAPTGWTKDVTHNNKALRVVNGTAGTGGTRSFTSVFVDGNVGNTTLTTAQLPAHGHTFSATTGTESADHFHGFNVNSGGENTGHVHTLIGGTTGSGSGIVSLRDGVNNLNTTTTDRNVGHIHNVAGNTGGRSAAHTHGVSGTTANAGSGDAHTHTSLLDVLYVDVIICTRN